MTKISVKKNLTAVPVTRTGRPGKSGYEQWLDAGNLGTIEDFFSYKYQDNTDYSLIFLSTLL
jgi:hypothetical protein